MWSSYSLVSQLVPNQFCLVDPNQTCMDSDAVAGINQTDKPQISMQSKPSEKQRQHKSCHFLKSLHVKSIFSCYALSLRGMLWGTWSECIGTQKTNLSVMMDKWINDGLNWWMVDAAGNVLLWCHQHTNKWNRCCVLFFFCFKWMMQLAESFTRGE